MTGLELIPLLTFAKQLAEKAANIYDRWRGVTELVQHNTPSSQTAIDELRNENQQWQASYQRLMYDYQAVAHEQHVFDQEQVRWLQEYMNQLARQNDMFVQFMFVMANTQNNLVQAMGLFQRDVHDELHDIREQLNRLANATTLPNGPSTSVPSLPPPQLVPEVTVEDGDLVRTIKGICTSKWESYIGSPIGLHFIGLLFVAVAHMPSRSIFILSVQGQEAAQTRIAFHRLMSETIRPRSDWQNDDWQSAIRAGIEAYQAAPQTFLPIPQPSLDELLPSLEDAMVV